MSGLFSQRNNEPIAIEGCWFLKENNGKAFRKAAIGNQVIGHWLPPGSQLRNNAEDARPCEFPHQMVDDKRGRWGLAGQTMEVACVCRLESCNKSHSIGDPVALGCGSLAGLSERRYGER